ncbi:hypothetical protein INR49_001369 [Caranx melampygus]|nr:hypothetical protein INR49_001369 [Caranx melampygus]
MKVGVRILQGLLGGQPQAWVGTGGEVADAGFEVRVQQKGAQQVQHLLIQQQGLEETQRVEMHLPVSICQTSV